MEHQKIKKFKVIGISVRTTNENGQSGKDIPALWNKFMLEKIAETIPNKLEDSLYCIYTEYEKDHTKPYTTLLGCKVASIDEVPEGLVGMSFEEMACVKHPVKGNLLQGVVFDEWTKIWNSDLDRAFTADFEIYGEKAQNPENAEVDIYIAVK